jgi:hypothetical protein
MSDKYPAIQLAFWKKQVYSTWKIMTKRRTNMKKLSVGFIIMAFLVGANLCFAESSIPNLVGTWSVKAEGGVITKGGVSGAKTHHSGEFSTLSGEAIVTKQQGRVLHGTFTTSKATEPFIAVIGMGNKTFFFSDEDGFLEGAIVNKDKINVVYRHVTPTDTVVAVGTWTRKK